MEKTRKFIATKQGSVLFIVLVIMSFMVILASAVFYVVANARQNVVMEYYDNQAYQTANDVLSALELYLLKNDMDFDALQCTHGKHSGTNPASADCYIKAEDGIANGIYNLARFIYSSEEGYNGGLKVGQKSETWLIWGRCAKLGDTAANKCDSPDTEDCTDTSHAKFPENIGKTFEQLKCTNDSTCHSAVNGYDHNACFKAGVHYIQTKDAVQFPGGGKASVLIYVNRFGDVVIEVSVDYEGRVVTTSRMYNGGNVTTTSPAWSTASDGDPGIGFHWAWFQKKPNKVNNISDYTWVGSSNLSEAGFLKGKCWVKDAWENSDGHAKRLPTEFASGSCPSADCGEDVASEACHLGDGWWVWIENAAGRDNPSSIDYSVNASNDVTKLQNLEWRRHGDHSPTIINGTNYCSPGGVCFWDQKTPGAPGNAPCISPTGSLVCENVSGDCWWIGREKFVDICTKCSKNPCECPLICSVCKYERNGSTSCDANCNNASIQHPLGCPGNTPGVCHTNCITPPGTTCTSCVQPCPVPCHPVCTPGVCIVPCPYVNCCICPPTIELRCIRPYDDNFNYPTGCKKLIANCICVCVDCGVKPDVNGICDCRLCGICGGRTFPVTDPPPDGDGCICGDTKNKCPDCGKGPDINGNCECWTCGRCGGLNAHKPNCGDSTNGDTGFVEKNPDGTYDFSAPGHSWQQRSAFHATGSPNGPLTQIGNLGVESTTYYNTPWTQISRNSNAGDPIFSGDITAVGHLTLNRVNLKASYLLNITSGGDMHVNGLIANTKDYDVKPTTSLVSDFTAGTGAGTIGRGGGDSVSPDKLPDNLNNASLAVNAPLHVRVGGDLYLYMAPGNYIKTGTTWDVSGDLYIQTVGSIGSSGGVINVAGNVYIAVNGQSGSGSPVTTYRLATTAQMTGMPNITTGHNKATFDIAIWGQPITGEGAIIGEMDKPGTWAITPPSRSMEARWGTAKQDDWTGGFDSDTGTLGNHPLAKYGIRVNARTREFIYYINNDTKLTVPGTDNGNSNGGFWPSAFPSGPLMIIVDTGLNTDKCNTHTALPEPDPDCDFCGARTINIRLNGDGGGGASGIFKWKTNISANMPMAVLTLGDGEVVFNVPDDVTYQAGQGFNSERFYMGSFNLAVDANTNTTDWRNCTRLNALIWGRPGDGIVTVPWLRGLLVQDGSGTIKAPDDLLKNGITARNHDPKYPLNLKVYLVHNGTDPDKLQLGRNQMLAGSYYTPNMRFTYNVGQGGDTAPILFGSIIATHILTNANEYLMAVLPNGGYGNNLPIEKPKPFPDAIPDKPITKNLGTGTSVPTPNDKTGNSTGEPPKPLPGVNPDTSAKKKEDDEESQTVGEENWNPH